MKHVQLRRHAEKGPDGNLTEAGMLAAQHLAKSLPIFTQVMSSKTDRTIDTAKLLTGKTPTTDARAGFYMASPEKSNAINKLAADSGKTYLEAMVAYNDTEVLAGVSDQADALNELIDELLSTINDGDVALLVSHDLSISPAMAKRGIPLESLEPLGGYVITDAGAVSPV